MMPMAMYALEVPESKGTLATNTMTVFTFETFDDASRFATDARRRNPGTPNLVPVYVQMLTYPTMMYRQATLADKTKFGTRCAYVLGDTQGYELAKIPEQV